jgi:glutathione S-transferase
MADVEIIGIPQSTYVRAVRVACEEKGIPYKLTPARPHAPEALAIHPFGKIPAFRHGDVELCESRAMVSYLDGMFPGARLIPAEPRAAAETEQWISLVNSVMDQTLIRKYLFAYILPKTPDKSPDRQAIEAVLPELQKEIALLDKAVAKTGYLAANAFTFADMNLLPILAYVVQFPEGKAAVATAKNLSAYYERHSARPSFRNTIPPPPPKR